MTPFLETYIHTHLAINTKDLFVNNLLRVSKFLKFELGSNTML